MQQPDQQNPWKIIKQDIVYDNNWISLIHHEVINPSGGPGIYGKVHFKNYAIGVIAVDDQLNTYLVGQFRFTLDLYSCQKGITGRNRTKSSKLDKNRGSLSVQFCK